MKVVIRAEKGKDGIIGRIYAHVDSTGTVRQAEAMSFSKGFDSFVPRLKIALLDKKWKGNISAGQIWLAEVIVDREKYSIVRPVEQIEKIKSVYLNIWTGEKEESTSHIVIPEEMFHRATEVKIQGNTVIRVTKFIKKHQYDKVYVLAPGESEIEAVKKVMGCDLNCSGCTSYRITCKGVKLPL